MLSYCMSRRPPRVTFINKNSYLKVRNFNRCPQKILVFTNHLFTNHPFTTNHLFTDFLFTTLTNDRGYAFEVDATVAKASLTI